MRTVEEIRANYKKFTDSKIEDLAKNESRSLRREILSVLKDEIIERNLDPSLIIWVDTENDLLTELEKKNLKEKIKHLPCPTCLKKNDEIKGYEISTVVSYLIYCDDKIEIKIACKDCARKYKLSAILKTFFLGWWSKRGILLTPYTLINELINFLFYKEKISNRIMDTFIDKNNGIFKLEGMENDTLIRLIKFVNKGDE